MGSDAEILAPRESLGQAGPDPRRWAALVVMLLAGFMNLLDVSIVNIAIPSIQRGLHASYADVQWTLAGYALSYALVLITGGRLGDAYGRKRLFLIGVIGFTIMSALCGAAQSAGMLIASRVGQGAMGALMIPQVLSAIQIMFPAAERIKALAAFGITAGLGAVSGPLLGGLLTSHDLLGLGWRSIFMINVPVGVIAVAASLALVRESRAPRPPRLDPVGVLLLSGALVLLLYPLVEGQQVGWPSWTYLMMALSGPVLAVFVGYERVKTRRDGSPLVELRMFARRGFASGMAIALVFFLGVASFGLVLTLFLQEGLGFSPLHAGASFIPFSLGLFVASGAAARLEPRFGRGVTMSGALIIAAGMAALIGIVHHYGAATTTWDMVPGLAVAGLGLGTVIAPLANVVLADVPEQDAGSASGVLNTGFQLGNSIGIALMGVVFIDRLSIGPGRSVPGVFAAALTHALWYQVGAFALAFLLMLALPGRRRHNQAASAVLEISGRARGTPARRTTHGGKLMTTQKLPGAGAARHGTGEADLTIMIAAHDAFRRDLTRLARAAGSAGLSDPAKRQSVAAGWELFKRQLHMHHTAEDKIIWPTLRPRLAHSENALSVLDAMEAEHERIDPLLASVDAAFGGRQPGEDRLADVIDVLTSTLTGHLAHEERDCLPLIGVALTAAEWRGAGRKMARENGIGAGGEMFAWILDGADREHAAATLGQLPPPMRLLYRAVWKPRLDKTPRW